MIGFASRATAKGLLSRRALASPALLLLAGRRVQASIGAVTLLVGGPPGGAADDWARGFAPFLERHMPGASIGVLNRPGEGGLAAARTLAAAQPDGRLIGAFATPLLLARAVEAGAVALLDQLSFVGAVAEEPVVLVGHPGTVTDLAELRALGERAVLGTPQAGSAAQLAGRDFARVAALPVLSFPNPAAARQAVLAGNIACAMLAVPDAIAALREDRLVGLGVAEAQRCHLLPAVPSFREQGVPLLQAGHRGFVLPGGANPAVQTALARALREVVADNEFNMESEEKGYIARFIGEPAWDQAVRRSLASLADRWMSDPWTTRRG
jgi:tripartite-type tricarboxylate transporter receptor subunit TctC